MKNFESYIKADMFSSEHAHVVDCLRQAVLYGYMQHTDSCINVLPATPCDCEDLTEAETFEMLLQYIDTL